MANLYDDSVTLKGQPNSHSAPVRPECVTSSVFAAKIDGVHTDFAIIVYSNRVMITVTQCGKLGCLYSIRKDSPQDSSGPILTQPTSIYSTQCLLGVDNIEVSTAIRFLAEKLDITKPILLSLVVKPLDFNTISAVAELLLKNRCW